MPICHHQQQKNSPPAIPAKCWSGTDMRSDESGNDLKFVIVETWEMGGGDAEMDNAECRMQGMRRCSGGQWSGNGEAMGMG